MKPRRSPTVLPARSTTAARWTLTCQSLLVLALFVGAGCQPSTSSPPGGTAPENTDAAADANRSVHVNPNAEEAAERSSDDGGEQIPVGVVAAERGATGNRGHDAVGLGAAARRSASSARQRDSADGTIEIVFEDIQLPMQADMVFRPFMLTKRVEELDGKRIRIHGYMLPDSKTKGITQFVLLKNTECKFGPGGQADHLINVLMTNGVTAKYRDDPISVEGVLKVNPFQGPDGNTWSIYDLACDHIETYRPRR